MGYPDKRRARVRLRKGGGALACALGPCVRMYGLVSRRSTACRRISPAHPTLRGAPCGAPRSPPGRLAEQENYRQDSRERDSRRRDRK